MVEEDFLLYRYFGAANRLATEEADFALSILHDTVASRVDSEVAAEHSAGAGALSHTNLTYDNLAVFNLLATI